MDRPLALQNPIRPYEWGSRSAIQGLLGVPTTEAPWAELWMGAHPSAPSEAWVADRWVRLDDLIHRFPEQVLGKPAAAKWQGALPYLLKLLAAEAPLSIQAHPGPRHAREGFERENREGPPLSDEKRNYKDPRHKPECICAITPFTGLKGFRDPATIGDALCRLCPGGLAGEIRVLAENGLKAFFSAFLAISKDRKPGVIQEALKNANRAAQDGVMEDIAQWVTTLHQYYPNDAAILAPAILNLFHLAPGEALFLPAGELHAYLKGFGVEIMANSDNVLRGGLTPKPVDTPELLRILNFEPSAPRILRPEPVSPHISRYPVFTEEFALSVVTAKIDAPCPLPPPQGPEILICIEGPAFLTTPDPETRLKLSPGHAALMPAACPACVVEGDALLFRAEIPGPALPPLPS